MPLSLPFGYPDSVSAVREGIFRPLSISVAHSGLYIYVIGSDEDGIMILRASTLEIVGRISVGDSPSDIAFNPADDRAFVTCRDSDQIFVLE